MYATLINEFLSLPVKLQRNHIIITCILMRSDVKVIKKLLHTYNFVCSRFKRFHISRFSLLILEETESLAREEYMIKTSRLVINNY